MKPSALLAVLVMASLGTSGGEKLPKPDRIPAQTTTEQKRTISEGIALHDAGQYDAAIAKYKQVLDESPDQIDALYETAFTYFTKKDYENALTVGRRGVRYQSGLLAEFYGLIGSSLDDSGKRDEAIDLYKAAIKQSPTAALLHFNLALALERAQKHAEARKVLQQAILLNPNHASSHYLLATIYRQSGYRIPAILALSRFLVLEPASSRTQEALSDLDQLIAGGVSSGKNPGDVTITLSLPSDAQKDEGDFGAVELAMSMSAAVAQTENSKKESSPFKLLAATYGVMAEVLSNTKGNGFATKYYAPFFAAMDKKNFTDPFVYTIYQARQLPGAAEWDKENEAKVQDFKQWLSSYRWPAAK